MFEPQGNSNTSIPATPSEPVNSMPPTKLPNTAPAPEASPVELPGTAPVPKTFQSSAKEPEDIFESTDRRNISSSSNSQAPPAEATPAEVSRSTMLEPQPQKMGFSQEEINKANEPSLRPAPSVFNRNGHNGRVPLPGTATADDVPPPRPPRGAVELDKKNLGFFIILVIIALGVVIAAAWWFFGRNTTPTIVDENEPYDLYNQPEQTANNSEETGEVAVNLPTPATLPPQPKDTDEDGLPDVEEMALGTSIDTPDTDDDGLFDREEVKIYKTDPLLADSDYDGVNDKDEIDNGTDPLLKDQEKEVVDAEPDYSYTHAEYKLSFQYLPNMTFESVSNGVILFNDNINQIKLYIYIGESIPTNLTPDKKYFIGESDTGSLYISDKVSFEDLTPVSTDLSTETFTSSNGITYMFRYVATKRATNHEYKFEQILGSVVFLQ